RGVDDRKDLLSGSRVRSRRDLEVGDLAVARSVDLAIRDPEASVSCGGGGLFDPGVFSLGLAEAAAGTGNRVAGFPHLSGGGLGFRFRPLDAIGGCEVSLQERLHTLVIGGGIRGARLAALESRLGGGNVVLQGAHLQADKL